MKKLVTTLIVILMIGGGLFYADRQSVDQQENEQGNKTIENIKSIILPDPMANNTYDEGQCTHHVFDLVKDDLNMIERRWGDAEHWAERAEADGYRVNQTPEEGSILQTTRGDIGHVAYVTDINENNSIEISEMNLYEPYDITERTIEVENIKDYNYIHPEENPNPKDTVS